MSYHHPLPFQESCILHLATLPDSSICSFLILPGIRFLGWGAISLVLILPAVHCLSAWSFNKVFKVPAIVSAYSTGKGYKIECFWPQPRKQSIPGPVSPPDRISFELIELTRRSLPFSFPLLFMFPISHIIAFPALPFQRCTTFPAPIVILLLSPLMRVSTRLLESLVLLDPRPMVAHLSLQCLCTLTVQKTLHSLW